MTSYAELKTDLAARPRRWLVTGVAGFIGSNLLEKLLRLDQDVVGLDNFSTGNERNIAEVQASVAPAQWDRFKLVAGDIRNINDCRRVVDGVDYVLHQAALGSVPRSIEDPITTNSTNVSGFLNMLVAARDAKVQKFVYASSSSVYGDSPNLPKAENHIGRPLSPYALTKFINEAYGSIFSNTFQMETAGLRYFNVFGPRQDPNGAYAAVIPRWIMAIMHDEEITIFGDGETSRDFCYIDNVVQANILAAMTRTSALDLPVFNVAVGGQVTLNELAGALRDGLNSHRPGLTTQPVVYEAPRPGDIRHSRADISKARSLLGYEPTHNFAEGVSETVRWYIQNRSNP